MSAGIKSNGAPDLAMLRMDDGAVAAAMFTTNLFAAAPVQISRDHLHNSRGHASVLIVNSGCANAATGPQGYADAETIGDYVAQVCGCAPDAVLMSLDTFNGLMETVHLLKSPANAAHLARSVEQYRSGQVQHRDLVDDE